MSSIPRGVLRQMAGGNDRPKDRWVPNEKKDNAIRLYRWQVPVDVAGVTTIEKRLCETRSIHFNGKGKPPTDCPGPAACQRCRDANMLEAQGTDEAKEKARQMRSTLSPTFVVVPIDEPTRFRTYDAKFSAFQGILLEIAKAGGWRSAKYPPADAWNEGSEIGPLFDKCVEQGQDKVCGPNGQDLVLSPSSTGRGTSWSVSRMQDANSTLPFPEDDKVIDPAKIQARIRAAMEKRAQGKEGDD